MKPANEYKSHESCPEIRVFIVDDHPVVRRGLKILFGLQPGMVVCGEAEGAAEAIAGIERCKPHLAIIDLELAEGSGFDVLENLRRTSPGLKVLVFSMCDQASIIERALNGGADAFVTKDEGCARVVSAALELLGAEATGARHNGVRSVAGSPTNAPNLRHAR